MKTRGQTWPLGPQQPQPECPSRSLLVLAASRPGLVTSHCTAPLVAAYVPSPSPEPRPSASVTVHCSAVTSWSRAGSRSIRRSLQPTLSYFKASAKTLGLSFLWMQLMPWKLLPNQALRCSWSITSVSVTVLGTGDTMMDETNAGLPPWHLCFAGDRNSTADHTSHGQCSVGPGRGSEA